MNLLPMVPLLLLSPLLSCATTGAGGPDRCSGVEIALDVALRRCLVDGLTEPERVAPQGSLDLRVSLRPPTAPGGEIGVEMRVVNVSSDTLVVDIATSELHADPRPGLAKADGRLLDYDLDPSCTDWKGGGGGGLGYRDRGRKAVARVTLSPGGSIAAQRSTSSRRELCVCAPDDAGVLDRRCTADAGGPVGPGTYGVGVLMPVAVASDDAPFTYLSVLAPLTLVDSGEPWPD